MKINENYRKGYHDAISQMQESLSELESSITDVTSFGAGSKRLVNTKKAIFMVQRHINEQYDFQKMMWEAIEDGKLR